MYAYEQLIEIELSFKRKTMNVCCVSLIKRSTMKNILPIKDKWFPDFAFLYLHNLQEIGSLTQVESLHIQTVLVNHNIVRVYLLKKKNHV